jgi:hypothetical protein
VCICVCVSFVLLQIKMFFSSSSHRLVIMDHSRPDFGLPNIFRFFLYEKLENQRCLICIIIFIINLICVCDFFVRFRFMFLAKTPFPGFYWVLWKFCKTDPTANDFLGRWITFAKLFEISDFDVLRVVYRWGSVP